MKEVLKEKHELTLRFDSSEELLSFAKKHRDKIVSMSDYKYYAWDESEEEGANNEQ